LRVEQVEAGQLGGAQSQAHLIADARDLVERDDDLATVDHALVHDEGHDLPRLGVEDQAADGADALAVSIENVGAEGNQHADLPRSRAFLRGNRGARESPRRPSAVTPPGACR
jgi:hypothetical protein